MNNLETTPLDGEEVDKSGLMIESYADIESVILRQFDGSNIGTVILSEYQAENLIKVLQEKILNKE
jgi:hypothetical protein